MVMNVVAEDNPRERRGSLVVLESTVGRAVVIHHMVRVVVRSVVVMVSVVIAGVVVVLLGRLALTVLFVLHPPVLEPYFYLAL